MKAYKSLSMFLATGLLLTTSMNLAFAQKGGGRSGAPRSSSMGNSSMRLNSGSSFKGMPSSMNSKPIQSRTTSMNKESNTGIARQANTPPNSNLDSKKPALSTGNSVGSQLANLKAGSKVTKPGSSLLASSGISSFAKSGSHQSLHSNFYCGTGWGHHHHRHWNPWGYGWGFGYHNCYSNHWCNHYCYSPCWYFPCVTSYCFPVNQYCYTSPVICQPMSQYVSVIEQESLPVTVIENTPVSSDVIPTAPVDNTFITGSVVGG